MSINKSCFDDAMSIVAEILNKYNISDKQYRIDKISKVYNEMIQNDSPDREFYSLVHEIKSFDFIKSFGEASLTNDEKHTNGPDIIYGKNKIECVCCSEGKIINAGYGDYSIEHCKKKSTVIDYNKTKEFVLPRITNSLEEKRKKIAKYINEKVIKSNESAIIFISLGELNNDFFAGTYGKEFLEILIGKGPLCYVFDKETKKFITCYWEQNEYIKKNKGKELVDISARFFDEDSSNIAGILLSIAPIYERYNSENTFLFLNPKANNPINIDEFNGIIYWKNNEKNEYIPMRDKCSLWGDIEKNIF